MDILKKGVSWVRNKTSLLFTAVAVAKMNAYFVSSGPISHRVRWPKWYTMLCCRNERLGWGIWIFSNSQEACLPLALQGGDNIRAASKLFLCSSKAFCNINSFEKIVYHEGQLMSSSQDLQKHERPMENDLPSSVYLDFSCLIWFCDSLFVRALFCNEGSIQAPGKILRKSDFYLFDREPEWTKAGEGERQRRGRRRNRLPTKQGAQCWAQSHNPGNMTCAEGRHLID